MRGAGGASASVHVTMSGGSKGCSSYPQWSHPPGPSPGPGRHSNTLRVWASYPVDSAVTAETRFCSWPERCVVSAEPRYGWWNGSSTAQLSDYWLHNFQTTDCTTFRLLTAQLSDYWLHDFQNTDCTTFRLLTTQLSDYWLHDFQTTDCTALILLTAQFSDYWLHSSQTTDCTTFRLLTA